MEKEYKITDQSILSDLFRRGNFEKYFFNEIKADFIEISRNLKEGVT